MTTAVTPAPTARKKSFSKPALWTIIALAAISVLIFTEYPIIAHPDGYTKKLISDRLLLFPHAAAGRRSGSSAPSPPSSPPATVSSPHTANG
jgi:hypothetical protein